MTIANTTKQDALTHSYLLAILYYNPDTGIFTWKVNMAVKAKAGDIAGSLRKDGYRQIMIHGCMYQAHRLAWFYYYEEWPINQIDHKDRNPGNNAISNLRDVNQSINNYNQNIREDNKSGHKGVHYLTTRQRWVAQIKIDGKTKTLGTFIDRKHAIKARQEAELKYHKGLQ